MAKDDQVSARVYEDRKAEYTKTAQQLGYKDLSSMLVDLLEVVSGGVEEEGWECRLLHISGGRIVGIGYPGEEGVPSLVSAFPIVAPERFWKRVEHDLQAGRDQSS